MIPKTNNLAAYIILNSMASVDLDFEECEGETFFSSLEKHNLIPSEEEITSYMNAIGDSGDSAYTYEGVLHLASGSIDFIKTQDPSISQLVFSLAEEVAGADGIAHPNETAFLNLLKQQWKIN